MKQFIVIGNWKMYKTFTETLNFFDEFAIEYKKFRKA
ncbi:triose-phosphate isomerase [Mycoplasmopsis bovis]|nr:triose-phosphate isomerase [Mycoplasmopsis bovis]WHL49487.1 triose-phosphate isomerase [Mycoplasmopsis bovis]